jgi:hypothetical protein
MSATKKLSGNISMCSIGNTSSISNNINHSEINNKNVIFKTSTYNKGHWLKDEQIKFIEGIIQYGFARNSRIFIQKLIKTRNMNQVISFTQKYFLKVKKATDKLIIPFKTYSVDTVLEILLSQFIRISQLTGVSEYYLNTCRLKSQMFYNYFRRILKDYIEKITKVQDQYGDLCDESSCVGGKDKDLMTLANTESTQQISTKNNTITAASQYHIPTAVDLFRIPRSSDFSEFNTLNINDFKGEASSTYLHDNLADNLREYFSKLYPNHKILENKTRKYKKYVINEFKDIAENIKFLNDIVVKPRTPPWSTRSQRSSQSIKSNKSIPYSHKVLFNYDSEINCPPLSVNTNKSLNQIKCDVFEYKPNINENNDNTYENFYHDNNLPFDYKNKLEELDIFAILDKTDDNLSNTFYQCDFY